MTSPRIALTGGIATGKSTVASLFAELGAVILDADVAARDVVQPNTPGWRDLLALLGSHYFDSRGNLLRSRLRERIVEDPLCRDHVNSILHPHIMHWMDSKFIQAVNTYTPGRIVIFDIPLLFEGGYDRDFGVIILSYVPTEIQLRRLMERDGLTQEQARSTLSIQDSVETKLSRSDIIIDNSGTIQETRIQVERAWNRLVEFSPPPGS